MKTQFTCAGSSDTTVRLPATTELSGCSTGWTGTCNWKIGFTPAPTVHTSCTLSTSPFNVSVRVQLGIWARCDECAFVRLAETVAPLAVSVNVMLDALTSSMFWPIVDPSEVFTKRRLLCTSFPCWIPLCDQMLEVTASQSCL